MGQFMDCPEETIEKFKTQHKRYLKAESRAISSGWFFWGIRMGESLQQNSPACEKKDRIGILENLQTVAEEYTLPGRPLCTEWRKKIADPYQSKEPPNP